MPDSPRPVYVKRRLRAAPDWAFDHWVDPGLIRRWLFVSPTSRITDVEIDLRPGGRFSILEVDGAERIDHYGVYTAVDRPRRLSFTLEVPKHFSGVTEVILEFAPAAGGCEMSLTQIGVNPNLTEPSWRAMFDQLERALDSAA